MLLAVVVCCCGGRGIACGLAQEYLPCQIQQQQQQQEKQHTSSSSILGEEGVCSLQALNMAGLMYTLRSRCVPHCSLNSASLRSASPLAIDIGTRTTSHMHQIVVVLKPLTTCLHTQTANFSSVACDAPHLSFPQMKRFLSQNSEMVQLRERQTLLDIKNFSLEYETSLEGECLSRDFKRFQPTEQIPTH